ncbi:MAG: peptide ABC transporter substrate-binding protein [Candidatus Limnocylindrales bacterium]
MTLFSDPIQATPAPARGRLIPRLIAGFLVVALLVLAAGQLPLGLDPSGAPATTADRNEVTILGGDPVTLDPAVQGDLGSAQVTAQLFETLTAVDPSLHLQPALASGWQASPDGRTITFTMRPNLVFSDGTPLGPGDVVRSWLRLINPAHPSPLASLLDEIHGARAYLAGQSSDPASVGLKVAGDSVVVTFDQPAGDFPALISGPSFGIVPPTIGNPASLAPGSFVGSGAYVLSARSTTALTLVANPHYWAGPAAIGTVHLLTTLGGASPVEAFEAGTVDYTGIDDSDASWLRYDPTLGPQLRSVPSLSVTYYGFDVRQKPFDDVRVRRAFAQAVDWTRIVDLANSGSLAPATSIVPPGIPGRSATDFLPAYDPAGARAELAAAGYPGGAGLPPVSLISTDTGFDAAILADLKANLGVTVQYESMGFNDYFERLASDPPAFWTLSWVADYPGANDFLGLLLGTGSSNNYGHWSSPDFDAAIARATAATDPLAASAAFDAAQAIVQSDVPVIPVAYGTGSALARTGLLGASDNGLGILRFAGLAWAP